jgi:hypothetical protein
MPGVESALQALRDDGLLAPRVHISQEGASRPAPAIDGRSSSSGTPPT